jgi:probable rRNA maturation factor
MPARFFEQQVISGLRNKRRLSGFVDKLIRTHLKNATKTELNYIFCSDSYLWELNKQYLNHTTLTDIITFDLSEHDDFLHGEIYISVERVKENAARYNTTYQDELHRVIFHGALHLCGFKDKNKRDQEIMRKNEDTCLQNYKAYKD